LLSNATLNEWMNEWTTMMLMFLPSSKCEERKEWEIRLVSFWNHQPSATSTNQLQTGGAKARNTS
jgi:hypothetical protein